MTAIPECISDVSTPCFLVDINKMRQNADTMRARCREMGVDLRAQVKTHKTIEGALIQTDGRKRKIAVSTLKEAEAFADAGFDDILYCRPFSPDKLARCRALTNRLYSFHLLVVNEESLAALKHCRLEKGRKWSVLLEVDSGSARAGVAWDSDEAVVLAKHIDDCKNTIFEGIYAHGENTYSASSVNEIHEIGHATSGRLLDLVTRLLAVDIQCRIVGTGSTPSCSNPSHGLAMVNELHPGTYIFYDMMQVLKHSCTLDEIACRVVTRVIGHCPQANRMIIDAGFLAISHDGMDGGREAGCCYFQGHPNLSLAHMSQELSYVETTDGYLDYEKYPIGTMLFLYPHHSCTTAALFQEYIVHSGEDVIDVWKPVKGW